MSKDFNKFMSQLQETNQTLDFFCDFDKIAANVDNIKLSLCMLNSMIGTTDLRRSVETIWNRDRSAFSVMDILIAVRSEGKKVVLNSAGDCIILDELFTSIDGVMEYLEGTGLADLFRQKKINDLVDYVFGIETGLDSNARKNRSGHVMEGMVASILKKNGIKFRQEVYSTEWSNLQRVLGDDEKRFDFVIKTDKQIYVIETNFYSRGGSKLNETARSYKTLAHEIATISGVTFIWFTDGCGWNRARHNLEETFDVLDTVYNIQDLENGVLGGII